MSRVIDIALRNGEVITVDVADLDPDPASILELLREGECKVRAWLRISLEYWRLGQLDASSAVAEAASSYFGGGSAPDQDATALPRIHALLANINLERSRHAPKFIFPNAQSDIWSHLPTKTQHYTKAAQEMNASEKQAADVSTSDTRTRVALALTRATFFMSTSALEDALKAFDQVLKLRPTNLPALMGKARICYVRKQHREALKLFQRALELQPNMKPDPRTGIGMCLWALGHKDKARLAWQRSAEVNPDAWASQLLLGIDSINCSKDPQRAAESADLYKTGLTMLQRVFKTHTSNAAAANALSDFFLRKGDFKTALKLAERTIQFSDTIALLSDGHLRAARVAHASGKFDDARNHYVAAAEGAPKNVLAIIGLAQMQAQNEELLAAIHGLDSFIAQSESDLASLEALIMLGSLRTYPRPAMSSADIVTERARARELFDRVTKVLDAPPQSHANGPSTTPTTTKNSNRSTQTVQSLRDDVEMHLEIVSLYQRDNVERAMKTLLDAIRLNGARSVPVVPLYKLRANLAVLKHLQGSHVEARAIYEEALPAALADGTAEGEMSSATILYDLARVYEDLAEYNLARDGYTKLLGRHPEYVDVKARLAVMRMDEKRYDEAHTLMKQALASGDKNPEIRGFYIWLLLQTGQLKPAKAFTFNVLKEDGHDIYALCAAGRISFNEARESRDPSPAATAARKDNFLKAANIYAKALSVDPSCAMAAQGLAILVAEDSLGSWAPGQVIDDAQYRAKTTRNAREALDIFAKVRESLSDGSVYVNMGHCHFVRDEFDKAIENYETASTRFYEGKDISVLSYLSRAWFAKANKIGSFPAMRQALKYSEMALHLQPIDKAVLYNIAMIEQKAAELLFSLPPDRRKLADLRLGISHASHAQKLFASLAADTSRPLPYSQDIAQNRYKYGESMLRRSSEHVAAQEAYEAEVRGRMDVARKQRQEEKVRLDEEQQRRLHEEAKKAEELALRRKELRERTEEMALLRRAESDEEDEKKARKAATRRSRAEASGNVSGDDEVGAAAPKRERKKRKTTKGGRKSRGDGQMDEDGLPDGGDEDDAVFSDQDGPAPMDEDGVERPKKSRLKKRVVEEDDDDGPATTAPAAKRKKFKSKEILDSDDDSDL